MDKQNIYYAHSESQNKKWHLLKVHLSSVSNQAKKNLRGWQKAEGEALIAGLLHDLGKYGDRFQARLHGKDSGLDHWSQGAWVALSDYHCIAAALAIQGHHIGLQYLDSNKLRNLNPDVLKQHHPLGLQLSEYSVELLLQRLTDDDLQITSPVEKLLTHPTSSLGTMLDIRLLFSELVDADFLDTEAHFQGDTNGKQYRKIGQALKPEIALTLLEKHLDAFPDNKNQKVSMVRKQLRQDCSDNAKNSQGLFTLTAPTGSGKTLAMLVFALAHAKTHKLRRVVIVIPYLSIIEQTAAVYRNIFSPHFNDDYIIEHHSLAGGGQETQKTDSEIQSLRRHQQLTENWDAPIIITTNVQLLESLFSNRPGQCRKLHRLRESVIVFDEAQTLPLNFVIPTLAALSHLAHSHKISVVFATATQPAFSHLHTQVSSYCDKGWQAKEIVNKPLTLFTALDRTEYVWHLPQQRWDWQYLAEQLQQHRQVLCIVNLKRHAQAILEFIDNPDVLHLSTNLCPAHRQKVLVEVRERLQNKQAIILIATQCIEAGVDVDFPIVYRAYAPLDAIIQAGGRCNREGLLEKGTVHIFCPEDESYPLGGGYQQAADMTKELLTRLGSEAMQMHHPEFIHQYYKGLYDLSDPSANKETQELVGLIKAGAFPEISKEFRLIKQDNINVVCPYQPLLDLHQQLDMASDETGLTKEWIERAKPITVSLYRPKEDYLIWDSLTPVLLYKRGQQEQTDWFIYNQEHYDQRLGLCPKEQLNLWIA